MRIKINNVYVDIDVSQTTVRQVAPVVMSKSPVLEHLPSYWQEKFNNLLLSKADMFATSMTDLGQTTVAKHVITTEGPPIYLPPYRVDQAHKAAIDGQIKEMLDGGIIRPSNSPYSAPIIMVSKKDGGSRMVVDYRKFNAQTRKDRYPLPRIDETIDSLHGAKIFSTLDLFSGFYQIELDESSKSKTAFVTPNGQYEFNRLPMGLCNSPATFQRCLNIVLRHLIGKCCLVYIDDIVLFSKSYEDHLEDLKQVFTLLRQAGLKIKLSKYEFVRQFIKYLGHVVSQHGVRPDPEKVAAISKIGTTDNV